MENGGSLGVEMVPIVLKTCRVTSSVYEPKHSRDNDHHRGADQEKQAFSQNLLPAVLATDPGSGDVEDRKKGGEAVDWSCRMCNNGKRIFRGHAAALRHAELHKAGLIATARPDDVETDTSDGGFSSGSDCLSEEEDESDLSSVSERETEHGSDNTEADDDGNEN